MRLITTEGKCRMNMMGCRKHPRRAAFLLEAVWKNLFLPFFTTLILWLMATSSIFKNTNILEVFFSSLSDFVFLLVAQAGFKTPYIVQAARELLMLLSLPLKCWDCRCAPSHWLFRIFFAVTYTHGLASLTF